MLLVILQRCGSVLVMEKEICVILINYNGKKYNEKCIDSILNSTAAEHMHIVVVDNASSDGSMELLQQRYEKTEEDRIEYIFLDHNYGFAAANNRGIEQAGALGADYVLLLNNDTEVDPNLIEQLAACSDRHPDCMIVPKIYYSDERNRIWSAGGSVSPIIHKVSHDGLDQIDSGQFGEEKRIEFATGCCLFIPMSVLRRTGGLDERYFLYYEDTEYSFRLGKMGIEIYYCPDAYVYHKVGGSSMGAQSPLCAYYISRNWLLCSRQYLGVRYPIFLAYYLLNRSFLSLLWLVQGKPQLVLAIWRGILDYCRKRLGKTKYYG